MCTKSILYISVLLGVTGNGNKFQKETHISIPLRSGKSKLHLTGIVWSESFTN